MALQFRRPEEKPPIKLENFIIPNKYAASSDAFRPVKTLPGFNNILNLYEPANIFGKISYYTPYQVGGNLVMEFLVVDGSFKKYKFSTGLMEVIPPKKIKDLPETGDARVGTLGTYPNNFFHEEITCDKQKKLSEENLLKKCLATVINRQEYESGKVSTNQDYLKNAYDMESVSYFDFVASEMKPLRPRERPAESAISKKIPNKVFDSGFMDKVFSVNGLNEEKFANRNLRIAFEFLDIFKTFREKINDEARKQHRDRLADIPPYAVRFPLYVEAYHFTPQISFATHDFVKEREYVDREGNTKYSCEGVSLVSRSPVQEIFGSKIDDQKKLNMQSILHLASNYLERLYYSEESKFSSARLIVKTINEKIDYLIGR